jgi:hypothetical protein
MESTFPLTPHFATLYFNKKIQIYILSLDERMYLLQVKKIS